MTQEGKIISLNISEKKGTIKLPVQECQVTENGIQNDAHSGPWNRQISLLSSEHIHAFSNQAGRQIHYGEFAENITTQGIDFTHIKPLDKFIIGDVVLEVTQKGKKCHGDSCAIFREVGNCVMPKEGFFCRVVKTGKIHIKDSIIYQPRILKILIITLSDRASQGIYEDRSGKRIKEILTAYCYQINRQAEFSYQLIADDPIALEKIIKEYTNKADFIFTTGGTGIGPRDITPDVIAPMLDFEIPGIMEYIRLKNASGKPGTLLSRSIAGRRQNTLIFCLPGSCKAVEDYLESITGILEHSLYMIYSIDNH